MVRDFVDLAAEEERMGRGVVVTRVAVRRAPLVSDF